MIDACIDILDWMCFQLYTASFKLEVTDVLYTLGTRGPSTLASQKVSVFHRRLTALLAAANRELSLCTRTIQDIRRDEHINFLNTYCTCTLM